MEKSWRQSQTECQSPERLLLPEQSVCLSPCLSASLRLSLSRIYSEYPLTQLWTRNADSCHHTGFYCVGSFLGRTGHWALSHWLESNNHLVPYVYPKCPLLSDHSYLVQKYPRHKMSTHVVKWYQMRGKMTKAGPGSCSSVPLQVVMGITFYESNLIVHHYQQYAIINMSHAAWCSHSVFH